MPCLNRASFINHLNLSCTVQHVLGGYQTENIANYALHIKWHLKSPKSVLVVLRFNPFVIIITKQLQKLKGQSKEIFDPLFSSFEPAWALTNGLKYFRFWLRFVKLLKQFLNLPAV